MTLLLPSRLRPPALLGAGRGAPTAGIPTSGSVAAPGAAFDLPVLPPCRHEPVLLILLFDNSPSVVGTHDAAGDRFREASIALDHFRRRCQCRRELVAVRTLDQRTSADAGPVHLDRAGWPVVTAALAAPPELGSGTSRMRRALLATERLAHAHPHHRTVLVVFSDFELYDPFPGKILDRLGHFPGQVHALVLGADPPARLCAGRVKVIRLTPLSPPGMVARAVVAAVGAASAPRGSAR